MAGEVRRRMVEGAIASLARRGLDATSFAEVLETSGAPRGSLYHHFPGGKDELIAAATDAAGAVLVQALASVEGQPPAAVVARYFAIWRTVLERSHCEAGCAVLAVTVATGSAELLGHATAVLLGWRTRLAELLRRGGVDAARARPFATLLVASAEGAVVLARAERSLAPFEAVAALCIEQARGLAGEVPPVVPATRAVKAPRKTARR